MDLRKIDALVAEKVMGWTLTNYFTQEAATTAEHYYDAANNDGWTWTGYHEAHSWCPTTDIAAAWLVVEKLDRGTFEFVLAKTETPVSTGWYCRFGTDEVSGESGDRLLGAKTAPLAICLAALAYVGVDVSSI